MLILVRLIRSIYRRCTGDHVNLESGLKLFLEKYDLEKLYDFEEECVEVDCSILPSNLNKK